MKKLLSILAASTLLLAPVATFTSCSTTQTTSATAGYDSQLVIRSEQTQKIAADTFDLFVTLEYQNRETLKAVSPKFKEYADVIRRNGIHWIETLRDVTRAYKHNRDPNGKANVMTALNVVESAISQSQSYINQSGLKGP